MTKNEGKTNAKQGKTAPRVSGLTPHDVARIRLETMCDVQTIRDWAKGAPVKAATDVRLTRAAAKLGLQKVQA